MNTGKKIEHMWNSRTPVLLALCACLVSCYNAPGYAGDAEFLDRGRTSPYPRFKIVLPEIQLDSVQTITTELREIPNALFDLRLTPTISGKPLSDREFARFWKSATQSELHLYYRVRQEQKVVFETSNMAFPGSWISGTWGDQRFIQLRPTQGYRLHEQKDLTIEIFAEPRDSRVLSDITLHPTLVGGGKDSW